MTVIPNRANGPIVVPIESVWKKASGFSVHSLVIQPSMTLNSANPMSKVFKLNLIYLPLLFELIPNRTVTLPHSNRQN